MQATFEDALESEALAKHHSLTREAVQTGQQCGAYRTLLTHFSQRYPKIPVFDASFAKSTCIAFDLMTVNLAGGFGNALYGPGQQSLLIQGAAMVPQMEPGPISIQA